MRHALHPGFGLLAIALLAACEAGPEPTAPAEFLTPQFAPGGRGGGGGGGGTKCRLGFELVLDESAAWGDISADVPGTPYIDGQGGVMVATSGTGLRFDTNGPGDESPSDRKVRLDLSAGGFDAHADPSVPKVIDLRFDHNNYPLNLCDMTVGQVVLEPAMLTFQSSAPGSGVARISFGWNPAVNGDGHECETLFTSSVRLSVQKTSANTWDVWSTNACFYAGYLGSVLQGPAFPFLMKFTITKL